MMMEPSEGRCFYCENCGSEKSDIEEMIFEYDGQYICSHCFLERVLTKEALEFVRESSEDSLAEKIADEISVSCWNADEFLENEYDTYKYFEEEE